MILYEIQKSLNLQIVITYLFNIYSYKLMELKPPFHSKASLPLFEAQRKLSCLKNLKKARQSYVEEILSDEEEKIHSKLIVDESSLKYEITNAFLSGSSFDVLIVLKKYALEGSLKERQMRLKQWLVQQFMKKGIDITNGYIESRRDMVPNKQTIFYPTKFILYGIDFKQTNNITNNYCRYKPKVTRIDASHCIVQLQDSQRSKSFIQKNLKEKGSIMMEETDRCPILKNWVELQGYSFLSFKRSIFARHLSLDDQKLININMNSDKSIRKVTKQIQKELLKDEYIHSVYEKEVDQNIAMKVVSPFQHERNGGKVLGKLQKDKQRFKNGLVQNKRINYKNSVNERRGDHRQYKIFKHKINNSKRHHERRRIPQEQQSQNKSVIIDGVFHQPQNQPIIDLEMISKTTKVPQKVRLPNQEKVFKEKQRIQINLDEQIQPSRDNIPINIFKQNKFSSNSFWRQGNPQQLNTFAKTYLNNPQNQFTMPQKQSCYKSSKDNIFESNLPFTKETNLKTKNQVAFGQQFHQFNMRSSQSQSIIDQLRSSVVSSSSGIVSEWSCKSRVGSEVGQNYCKSDSLSAKGLSGSHSDSFWKKNYIKKQLIEVNEQQEEVLDFHDPEDFVNFKQGSDSDQNQLPPFSQR